MTKVQATAISIKSHILDFFGDNKDTILAHVPSSVTAFLQIILMLNVNVNHQIVLRMHAFSYTEINRLAYS